jgi:hypothetical protein
VRVVLTAEGADLNHIVEGEIERRAGGLNRPSEIVSPLPGLIRS